MAAIPVGPASVGVTLKAESQVQSELNKLDKATSELVAILESLNTRLNTVCRAEPTPPLVNEGKIEQPLVSVAESIRYSREKVEGSINLISDILRTIEL